MKDADMNPRSITTLNRILLWACCLAGGAGALAQNPADPATRPAGQYALADGRVGMNFSAVAFYQANDPWKNLFKSAKAWTLHGGPQDKPADFELDENGYIKRLPKGEVAVTHLGMTRVFPAGDYLLLYDGQGSFQFGIGASAKESRPGRIVVHVGDPAARQGIRIALTSTDPQGTGDYVRNIRFIEPRFEADHQTDPWHPRFLELWKDYSIVRFMCWQEMNGTTLRDWKDNTPRDYVSFNNAHPIPPEWIVEFLNRTGKDGWICIPHLASDDYAQQLGRFLRSKLRPEVKLVIEYANEFWHPGFPAGRWAQEEGRKAALGRSANEQRILFGVQRAGELFRAFERGFGSDQKGRVLRTVGSLSRGSYYTKLMLSRPEAGTLIDAIAVAPYIGSDVPARMSKGEIPKTLDAVFEACQQDIEMFRKQLAEQAAMCRQKNMLFIAYEGGPHLTPKGDITRDHGGGNNAEIRELCHKASYDPRMNGLCKDFLDMWRVSGGKMFVWFTASAPYSDNCMMGMLESIYEDPEKSPKYQSVRQWMQDHPKW